MTYKEKRLEEFDKEMHRFITSADCTCCKRMGNGCSMAHLNSEELKAFLSESIEGAIEEERERVSKNIGMLRQWLNEKPEGMIVTYEAIERWLSINNQDK